MKSEVAWSVVVGTCGSHLLYAARPGSGAGVEQYKQNKPCPYSPIYAS